MGLRGRRTVARGSGSSLPIVETVPFWFHRLALNRAEGIFTPGSARERRSRVSAPSQDFAGISVLDVGCFDGFYAFLAERRGGPRRSWR